MANPLQPKVIKYLEDQWDAYVVNVSSVTKRGVPDLLVCIDGIFYGFEIKWAKDRPSESQKRNLNLIQDAGGKGIFVRSVEQLDSWLRGDRKCIRYKLKSEDMNIVL